LRAFVAVTDGDWFRFLSARDGIDEVNFWQPGGGRAFRALLLGEPLLFKLHHRDGNRIVGGGFFAHFAQLPVSIAWETFGFENGARSYAEMRARIEKYRKIAPSPREDYEIGCIMLEEPFFLPRERWIETPSDFHPNVVVGKTYDLAGPVGRDLWQRVIGERAVAQHRAAERSVEIPGPMYGEGLLAQVRLGQGAFRIMVSDAYSRRCAISGEKALLVLQAAHIKPVALGGQHRLDNGLLLRSDVHTLFDLGYITVTPEHRVLVAKKQLKEDFDNGEPYVPFNGKEIYVPERVGEQPASELLEWHADTVFRG
jgi:putative restriction endonuclease